MLYFIIYPLVMAFNVEENVVFITRIFKNLPTVGGGSPPTPSIRGGGGRGVYAIYPQVNGI